MQELFQKLFWCTDQHFGRSGNSPVANKDNLDFFKWAIAEAQAWGAETCILGGDLFDSRHSIGVITINAALNALDMLQGSFEKVYALLGNHDLPFRDRRDSASVEIGRNHKNFHIVRDPITIGDVTLLPWLVGDELKTFNTNSRYVFGHLELSGFLMNSRTVMPETDHSMRPDIFKEQEYVFSGHYHARQFSGNICYTGSCMPHNFSDDGDSDRGIMLLEFGKEPIFRKWPNQPLYQSVKLSEMLADPDALLRANMTVRVTVDVPLRYEETQEIREALIGAYNLRKIEFSNGVIDGEQTFDDTKVQFRTVDQIVINGLESVESVELSNKRLIEIYMSLEDR